jgi:hypothetical protein
MARNKQKLTTRFIDGIKAQTVDNVNSGSLVDVIVIVFRAIGRVIKSLEILLNESLGGDK